ncbi:MAG: hypothetical protein NTU98_09240 [Bacteroidetes bacterium]|nr:hypothetical protein [Bacteroidota bacterium]
MTGIVTTLGIWIGIIAGLWTIFDPRNGLLSLITGRRKRKDDKNINSIKENKKATSSEYKTSKESKANYKFFPINIDLVKVFICFVLSHFIIFFIIQRNFPSFSNQFYLNPFSLELYNNIKVNYIPFNALSEIKDSFHSIVIAPYLFSFCLFITLIVLAYIKEITHSDDGSFVQIPMNIIFGILTVGLFSFNFPTVLLLILFIPLKVLDFFIYVNITYIMNILIPVLLFLTYYFPPFMVYWYKRSNDTGDMLI